MLNKNPNAVKNMTNFGIHHNLTPTVISRFWGFLEPPVRIADSKIFHDFSIGAFSYLSGGFFYHSHIGRYCSFANEIHMGQGNHPMTWLSTHPFQYQKAIFNVNRNFEYFQEYENDKLLNTVAPDEIKPGRTVVGNDCWIGTGAYLKNGIEICDGAVIGAKSVVTKNVPPYAIVVGSPAKIIRYRFPEPTINKLMQIQWWKFAPWQLRHIDFSKIDNAIDQVEEMNNSHVSIYSPKVMTLSR